MWNEFQGVIRGSEQSLTGSKGYIDRETYESLSFRKQAAFSNHRTQIYDIFESYMREKRMRGQYDASDRQALAQTGDIGRFNIFAEPMHYFDTWRISCLLPCLITCKPYFSLWRLHSLTRGSYVDEVQDNLLIDIKRA